MNDPNHPSKSDIEKALEMGPASPDEQWTPRAYWVGGIGGVLVLALLYWMLFSGSGGVEYRTGTVTKQSIVVTVTATGTLKPVNQVDVGAEISGIITDVFVTFNDPVTKGQPLAELNTVELAARVVQGEASLLSAEAGLAEAQATAQEARTRRDRVANLAERRTLSQQELEVAEATLARADAAVTNAQAQVTLANANLEIDKTNLEKAIIRSPIDGIILDRKIEPGQTVASSFQTPELFTLAEDLRKMQLHVDVDEADVGRVAPNQMATFTVDAYPDRKFEARVDSVRNAPRTVQGVVTYEAVLDVDNSDMALRPGMTATADITIGQYSDVLTVPNGALRFTPPGVKPEDLPPATSNAQDNPIWISEYGRPKAIMVTKGASDGRYTVITGEGVSEGREVLVDVVIQSPRQR